jgi:chromosome segregation ATPase
MSDLELTMMRRVGELKAENARLKAEVERLTALVESNLNQSKRAMANSDASVRTLEAQVERLTKAVMHSPAAQLKLKELEGKTTFDEINPDNQMSEPNQQYHQALSANRKLLAENARLKAEVERAGHTLENLNVWHDEALDKNDNLKAEVERLTNELEKQDLLLAMANAFVTDWNAAKEGKGQP